MAIHKGKSGGGFGREPAAYPLAPLRRVVLSTPLLCLLAYALGLPLPVPRFLVPEAERASSPGSIAAVLKDVAAEGFHAIRIVTTGHPTAHDYEAATAHYGDTGMPVRFVPPVDGRRSPNDVVSALSVSLEADGGSSVVSLLLNEEAAGPVLANLDGNEAIRLDAPPPDRRVTLPLGASAERKDAVIALTIGQPGGERQATLRVALPGTSEPKALMAGGREGARSVLEALGPTRRVSWEQLGTAGIYGYELIILDGPSIPAMPAGLAATLADYVTRGAGSLFVFVDSADFGTPGDAPELEAVLPVELSPRSLSRLPDVAMAVALDVSGSMYGDKLSLAKAVGLELVGNLKQDDMVGILLFDEEARWLNPLAPVAQLDARRSLAPLRAGGGTRLAPAIELCLEALEASGQPDKRLVLVSDGISEPADFDALATRAFRAGISISSMAVGEEFDKAVLTRIAAGSGGRFYRVEDASGVPSLIVEDRKSISRTVFSEQTVAIVNIAGQRVGTVDGMARLGLKPEALAFFSSEAGDPLLSVRREGSRSAIVFASDAYGQYDAEFLAQEGTLAVLDAILTSLYSEQPPTGTLTQTADGLSLSIHSNNLVAPRALLVDDRGTMAADMPFDVVAPGLFYAAFATPPAGAYTALVIDRGRTVARFPVYANAGLSGRQTDSVAAAASYHTPFWAMPRGDAPWLLAFFALSLVSTVLLRIRR